MKAWKRDQRVLLAVSGVLIVACIVFCVLAEQSALWFQAQASLAAILVLLGLVAWNWWHSPAKLLLTHELQSGQYAFYLLRGFQHSSAEEGSGFVYCLQVD